MKIKLTTVILIILILIIGLMAFFTGSIYIENKEKTKKIYELNNKIENLTINTKTEILKSEKLEETKEHQEIEKNIFKKLEGIYNAKIDYIDKEKQTAFFELKLFENGTFDYVSTYIYDWEAGGYIGNYTYDEGKKEIYLNVLFNYGGNGGMLFAKSKTITLQLNDDGSIQDKNDKLIKDIKLVKDNRKIKEEDKIETKTNNFLINNSKYDFSKGEYNNGL